MLYVFWYTTKMIFQPSYTFTFDLSSKVPIDCLLHNPHISTINYRSPPRQKIKFNRHVAKINLPTQDLIIGMLIHEINPGWVKNYEPTRSLIRLFGQIGIIIPIWANVNTRVESRLMFERVSKRLQK